MPFDAASNNRVNPGTSLTQAHTCTGSNRALVVVVAADAAADRVTGVTYAGNAMTLVTKGQPAAGARWLYVYYLSAPPAGTANIVVSASASVYIELDAASYTDITQTGQPIVIGTMGGATSGTSRSTDLTTTVANCRVILAALGQGGGIAAGASTTLRTTNLVAALLDSGTLVSTPSLRTLIHTQAASNIIGGVSIALEEGAAPSITITLTDVVERRVIQRNGTTGSITISGTHSGATSVQARVVQHGTSTEVLTWTTIDAAPGGSTWSGTLTGIPQGGWYNIQVRPGNSTGTVANGANRFGVGVFIAPIGQSQMRNWFDNGTAVTPDDRLVQYSGSNGTGWAARTSTGNGANTFGNAMVAALGGNIPVALLRYAIGATSLLQVADAGNGWWLNTAGGSPYALFKAGVDSIGGKLEAVAWAQGEQDGFSNLVSESDYATALATLCARIRTDFAQPTLPIVIVPLGRYTNAGPTDASWQGIQSALATVGGQANNTLSSTVLDLALADGVHFTDAAYTTHGTRVARAVRAALGLSSYAAGPVITGATLTSSTTVQVNLAHAGGTDFTPSTAITGFEVLDNGTPATITAAVRTTATAITLTVSAPLVGAVTVRHLYGRNPVISSRVLDNSAEALPLRSVGSLAAGGTFALSPTGIANANAFGLPTVTRLQAFGVSPSAVASTSALGNPTLTFSIGSNFAASPAAIASTNAFGNPALSFSFPQTFALQVAGIASTVAFGATTATFDFPVLDEPVSVAQARSYIRFDGTELDADIALTITQAREQAEHITGRFYRRRVERVESEGWPLGVTMLPFHEAAAVTISYLGAADPDTWTELPSTVYRWSAQGFETRLQLRTGQAWPELAPSEYGVRVRIEVTVGLINPSTASASVRRYILASVAAWAEQPSAQRVGGTLGPNPLFEHLLDVERLWR